MTIRIFFGPVLLCSLLGSSTRVQGQDDAGSRPEAWQELETADRGEYLGSGPFCSLVGPSIGQGSPYPAQLLRPFERIVIDLATVGRKSDAEGLFQILSELGYSEKALTKLAERQAKVRLAKRVDARRLRGIGRNLSRATKRLVKQLAEIADTKERKRVASVLLRIDGDLEQAHRVLGHVKLEGRWVLPETKAMAARKAAIQVALQQVRKLTPDIQVEPGKHELIQLIYGKPGYHLSFRGFEIHTAWPIAKTKRLMSNVIRAVVFSKFLIDGSPIALPKKLALNFTLLTGKPQYLKAIADDIENGRVTAETARIAHSVAAYYRKDSSSIGYFLLENEALAGLFSLISGLISEELHGQPAHATIVVGHANWVLMALTGAQVPKVLYNADKEVHGSSADKKDDDRKFLLGAGLMGARSWLREEVMRGTDPAWSRSFVDQVGMITGTDILKTTFVAEYLHYLGPLSKFTMKTRKDVGETRQDLIDSLEKSLGMKTSVFEEKWRRWMRGANSTGSSLLGRLGGKTQELSKVERSLIAELARIRKSILVRAIYDKVPVVTLDRELSESCILHARYLNKHGDQLAKWPDAHEEYTDREGFTPEGCWAGGHSVIAPGVTTAKQALDAWMGTYFHRLPLLDPGLFRVGWGLAGTTAVMDSGSMVRQLRSPWEVAWPHDGMRKVPLRFNAEMPNPYPGLDQGEWGYPITLQLGPREEGGAPEIVMTLHKGSKDGPLVRGRLSSPQSPGNPLLVPKLTWCFIPAEHLIANTSYHVTAVFSGTEEKTSHWSFSTGK